MTRSSSAAARALALALVALLATSALAGNDNANEIPPVKAIHTSNPGTKVKVGEHVLPPAAWRPTTYKAYPFFSPCRQPAPVLTHPPLPASRLPPIFLLSDGDVASTKGVDPYFADWEWNTPDVDSMLCKWSSDTNSKPVCGASVGASANPFFIAPMYQAGKFDKPVTAMLYAQRTCVGESRICVVALANRGPDGCAHPVFVSTVGLLFFCSARSCLPLSAAPLPHS